MATAPVSMKSLKKRKILRVKLKLILDFEKMEEDKRKLNIENEWKFYAL